ncbi:MAG: alkaline shock response membrane anchor protein AmaP [Puniceicoccaceae bacterium]|nr:MAG: alkaline shock response membrane anchor protein AmaP [Puniceicoccaceae bacterium]
MILAELNTSIEYISRPEFIYIVGAALLFAFVLILFIRRQPRNVVAYTTDNGQVMVSRHAIVELVQTSCEQLKDVSKPQVKIKVKGHTAHFEVRLKLQCGGRLREIEHTLQNHLRRALTENLGIESLGRINIVATGFKSGRIDSKIPNKEAHPPATESSEPYGESDEVESLDFDNDAPHKGDEK